MLRESLLSPVLTKELKQRFRGFRGSLVVMFYVGVVVAITLAFVYLTGRHGGGSFQPEGNREFFIVLSMLQLFLIAFVTPGLSAGVISSERERQTLNILLTTRLSPASIILSKLISSLAFTILLVITTLPIYAMVTLYGGIAPNQLAGVFGLYLLSMIFCGSVGIFLSTSIRKTAISTVAAYGFIFVLVVFTFLGAEMLEQYFRNQHMLQMQGLVENGDYFMNYQSPQIVWFLRNINPIVVMLSLFEPGMFGTFNAMSPWKTYTITYSILSIILILLSIYLLPPVKRRFRRS